MLRSVEVTANVEVHGDHQVHWKHDLMFSVDCFICCRLRRSVEFTLGSELAACTGGRQIPAHPHPGRISGFDTGHGQRLGIRVLLDYWWAPFHDLDDGRPATALTEAPWVRLRLGYFCALMRSFGDFETQTNMVRPFTNRCSACHQPVFTDDEVPRIRLLA